MEPTNHNLGDLHPSRYIRVAKPLGVATTVVDVEAGTTLRRMTLRYVVTCFCFWPESGVHMLAGYRIKRATGATFGQEHSIPWSRNIHTVGRHD